MIGVSKERNKMELLYKKNNGDDYADTESRAYGDVREGDEIVLYDYAARYALGFELPQDLIPVEPSVLNGAELEKSGIEVTSVQDRNGGVIVQFYNRESARAAMVELSSSGLYFIDTRTYDRFNIGQGNPNMN